MIGNNLEADLTQMIENDLDLTETSNLPFL